MKIEIFCNESLIILSDTRPSKKNDSDLQLQFTGKKALREFLSGFERRSTAAELTIWSEDSFDHLRDTFFDLYEKVEAAGGKVLGKPMEIPSVSDLPP